jgi:hypothetical protein
MKNGTVGAFPTVYVSKKKKHANSFNLSPIVLKYSRNTLLYKILFRQSKKSHTGEQMPQISEAKMG